MSRQKSTENSMGNNWKKEYQKDKGKDLIKKIQRLKQSIPKRFKNKGFYNFNKSRNLKGFEACRQYARDFLDNLKSGKGLFITGTVGTGKTHLAISIIDYIARILKRKIYGRIIFTTAIDLLSEIKYSYETKDTEGTVNFYEECDLLVIDDLGIEKSTDWTHELFYKIIDSRYSNMLPTIITTNLTDIEIKEKLSERIISRIYEMCQGVKLTGKDYRI